MNYKWRDDRCIICSLPTADRDQKFGDRARFTKEHVIPESIGGRLTCDFACKNCNDALGQAEAHFKEDASVRLAIENLKEILPNLHARMSEGQKYVVQRPQGTVKAKLRNGQFNVNSSRQPDGSLILSLNHAQEALRKMLERSGEAEPQIKEAIGRLKMIPEGSRERVTGGCEVVKWTTEEIYPDLTSHNLEHSLLKIAYEYLALLLESGIFHSYFDPVREMIVQVRRLASPCSFRAFRLKKANYRPFHGIAAMHTSDGTRVQVVLFGYLSYHIDFGNLSIGDFDRTAYTLNLRDSQEEWTSS